MTHCHTCQRLLRWLVSAVVQYATTREVLWAHEAHVFYLRDVVVVHPGQEPWGENYYKCASW